MAHHTADGGVDGCQLENGPSLVLSMSSTFSSRAMKIATECQVSDGPSQQLSPKPRFSGPLFKILKYYALMLKFVKLVEESNVMLKKQGSLFSESTSTSVKAIATVIVAKPQYNNRAIVILAFVQWSKSPSLAHPFIYIEQDKMQNLIL
ncbi:hypothetical protein HAX54_028204 [Datura stramonium]|uniref:Uncharacterized protein n=1 Tax=Datura stramonium TaxID=4076 RepID=A0ABS8V6J0_DATST|nr:hypothetical protein [Datura stramonium]